MVTPCCDTTIILTSGTLKCACRTAMVVWHITAPNTYVCRSVHTRDVCAFTMATQKPQSRFPWWSHQIWKHFTRYWSFVWGNHRSPVNSPHKGQWRGALMFSLICAWTNGWVNNRDAGYLRRHRAHYDVTVMQKGDSYVVIWGSDPPVSVPMLLASVPSSSKRIKLWILGLYSLRGRTSYRMNSWSLEGASFYVIMIASLYNLTGISEALLPRCPSNFKAVEKSNYESSGFEISRDLTVRRPSA